MDKQITESREKIRNLLRFMNPNVEVPMPKLVEIKKVAINIDEYDQLRDGVEVQDLKEPALQIPSLGDHGYEYVPLIHRRQVKKRKRNEEVKLFDFVDSTKAI